MNLDTPLADNTPLITNIMIQKKDMHLVMIIKINLVHLCPIQINLCTIGQIQELTILNWASLSVMRMLMTWLDILPRRDSHLTEEMSPEPATPAMLTQVKGFTEIHILLLLGAFWQKKIWKQFGTALAGKGIYYYSNPRTNTNIVFKLFISFKSVCPSGWKEFRDNCYGFVPRYMSFTKAKQFCVARKVQIVLLD